MSVSKLSSNANNTEPRDAMLGNSVRDLGLKIVRLTIMFHSSSRG